MGMWGIETRDVRVWKHGMWVVESWRNRDVKCGNMGMQGYGDMVWKHGDVGYRSMGMWGMEEWRQGNAEYGKLKCGEWRHGSIGMEIWARQNGDTGS